MQTTRAISVYLLIQGTSLFAAAAPSFKCVDAASTRYEIATSNEARSLRITRGTVTQDWPLAAPNIARQNLTPSTLVYGGWDRNQSWKLTPMDFGREFSVRFETKAGKSVAFVNLVVDHQEPKGLACTKVGQAMTVTMEPLGADPTRYLPYLDHYATQRDIKGNLRTTAIKGIESMIRRLQNALVQSGRTPSSLPQLSEPIKKISPDAVATIGARLPASAKTLWESILLEGNYAYYPQMSRLASWVVDGARNPPHRDLDSIVNGVQGFTKLPVFEQKDMKDIFLSTVRESLVALSEEDLGRVNASLDAKASGFLTDAWMKTHGRKTLIDYPRITETLSAIQIAIHPKKGTDFDPAHVQSAVVGFFRSPLAGDKQARSLFTTAASALMKEMTDRQQEDVLAWVEKDERPYILELLQ